MKDIDLPKIVFDLHEGEPAQGLSEQARRKIERQALIKAEKPSREMSAVASCARAVVVDLERWIPKGDVEAAYEIVKARIAMRDTHLRHVAHRSYLESLKPAARTKLINDIRAKGTPPGEKFIPFDVNED